MLPRMPFRRRLRTLSLVGCIAAAALPSLGLADEAGPAAVAEARKHFDKARAYYGQGAYREAVSELEKAHALDPNAKELVFNLGVVHEKLADIDEALNWFRRYTTMDLAPQERDRADAYIRRLEGSKREVEEKLAAQQQPPAEPAPSPPEAMTQQAPAKTWPPRPSVVLRPQPPSLPPAPPSMPPNGRIDALTVSAASVSAVALALGAVFAVKAEANQPTTRFVTGVDGTYWELAHRVDVAWHWANAADVAFGVALVSGIATAYLYFERPRSGSRVSTGSTTVSAGPLMGGGTLILKGSF
jgi:tetratricopeptide (TPR) repeat protein